MRSAGIFLFSLCALLFSGCKPADETIAASGTFEATEVIVSSEASGKILDFTVSEGDAVTAGQVVGHIDSVQLQLQKDQLFATIKAVESRRPDVDVQVAALLQQIETAKAEKKRIENLLKADAANQKQLDDIEAQILTLEKQFLAQRTVLQNSSRGITQESSALGIQIAQIDDRISKCKITSPLNGTVLVKYAEAGELAAPGKALFKVADVKRMYLRAYITSAQLSLMQLGQTVTVLTDFGKQNSRSYSGKIIWISEQAEFTPKTVQTQDERENLVYAVKVAVQNDGYLKIGMYGGIKTLHE